MISWFIFCVFSPAFKKMAKCILIQTSLHSFLAFFLYILASVWLTRKYLMHAVCLVDVVSKLKCRRKTWKACQNWNVFQDFCKKCLWKYFCCLCFLSEDIAGNSNWKHSLCNLSKTLQFNFTNKKQFQSACYLHF